MKLLQVIIILCILTPITQSLQVRELPGEKFTLEITPENDGELTITVTENGNILYQATAHVNGTKPVIATIPLNKTYTMTIFTQLQTTQGTINNTLTLQQDNTFTTELTIPKSHKTIKPGEEVVLSIKITNRENKGRIDAQIQVWITYDNKTISSKTETVAIETQSTFVEQIQIPNNSPPGTYTAHTKVILPDGKTTQANQSFIVQQQNNNILYYGVGLVIAPLLIRILFSKKFKKYLVKNKVKKHVDSIVRKRKKS